MKPTIAKKLSDYGPHRGTPDQRLIDNPGKTLAETMSDAELVAYMQEQMVEIPKLYEIARSGGERALGVFERRLAELRGGIAHLREAKRIPETLDQLERELDEFENEE